MGYVFDFKDALAYERWFTDEHNHFISDLEINLMLSMLKPIYGETVLDIGCGTGACLLPLLNKSLQVTGLDPSTYMIDIAREKVGDRVDFHRGFAEDLPFDDNTFNYSVLFTTLEFVNNPKQALMETFRVTKDKVFIGMLNRYALVGIQRRIKGIFSETIFNKARFFSIWEMKRLVREILGPVPLSWRTICQLPASGKIINKIERSGLIQRFPFGAFAGINVIPVPRYKTRPLALKYRVKQKSGGLTGYAGRVRDIRNKTIINRNTLDLPLKPAHHKKHLSKVTDSTCRRN
jgi:ubiquinone/menaquinone biosynthesis C-methylase UbiE